MSTAGATLPVRIVRKHMEAHGICSLELKADGVQQLPHFSAGSHIDLHLPGHMVRQYSLCNATNIEDRYQICVLREPSSRGGSVAVHEQLQEGQVVHISEPKNHFPLVHGAASSLLIAAGIGITPIICMAERLHHAQAVFEMHYCAKSEERAAFRTRILRSPFASRVHFHFSSDQGRVDVSKLLEGAPPGTHLYVCGPKAFITAVLRAASERGWPQEFLHQEYFASEVSFSSDDDPFEVEIVSTGQRIAIAPRETILSSLADAGIELPSSCEQGVCGTCLTRVLKGVPDHRDAFLTPEEQAANDQFLPCCSRSKTPLLVLDL